MSLEHRMRNFIFTVGNGKQWESFKTKEYQDHDSECVIVEMNIMNEY